MKVRPRLFRIASVAAVLVPFGASVAAHAVSDRGRDGSATDRPALAFGEYLVNLGRLPDGAAARGVFRFRNTGETPLTILGFSPSCGCLRPKLDERRYAPEATGTFVVLADTANEARTREDSFKTHYVDVRYDAGQGEETARVHLNFVLPARHVVVEPRSLRVYQTFDESTAGAAAPMAKPVTITVSDPRTPPVTVLGVDCASSALTVEPRLAESAADATRASIDVTIPTDLDRDVRAALQIRTDDPQNPLILVPIEVMVRKATPIARTAAESAGGSPRK